MASRGVLSGLQKMMLRWEEFHPVNAAHVVRLGVPESAGVVERVSGSDALVLIGRRSIWLPLRRLKLVAY